MSVPVNLAPLREMTDGDRDIERVLFEEFCYSAEKYLTQLEENLCDGESELWRATMHSLREISASIGAEKLISLCAYAQNSHNTEESAKRSLLAGIRQEYEEIRAYLEKVVSQAQSF